MAGVNAALKLRPFMQINLPGYEERRFLSGDDFCLCHVTLSLLFDQTHIKKFRLIINLRF